MHQAGWVHGDLRSTNVVVKKSGLDGSFLIIDFDWIGKNQEVVYPTLSQWQHGLSAGLESNYLPPCL
jgi:RIO-like serine/threonine protein kinase